MRSPNVKIDVLTILSEPTGPIYTRCYLPKTQGLLAFLSSIESKGKVLVLTDGKNENLYLSSRNLSDVAVVPFGGESVYDVLWAHTVVIERSALDQKAQKAKSVVEAAPVVEEEPATEPEVEPEVIAEEEPVAEAEPDADAELNTEEDDDA